MEIVPVAGSMTMFCKPESEPEMMMPFVEPGGAMYGRRFGSGVLSAIDIGANLVSSKHFLTAMSSWLKDHSSAEIKVVCCALSDEAGVLIWFETVLGWGA